MASFSGTSSGASKSILDQTFDLLTTGISGVAAVKLGERQAEQQRLDRAAAAAETSREQARIDKRLLFVGGFAILGMVAFIISKKV